jgi:hypothetical protein
LPVKITTIQFRNSPGSHVIIETDGSKVRFTACKNGNCAPVGKGQGYTPQELTDRYKELRKSVWLNRLLVIPAGAVCSMLLGGAVGYLEVLPLIEAAGQATSQMMDAVSRSIENGGIEQIVVAPVTIGVGAVGVAAVSGMTLLMAYAIIYTYAITGLMIGLPGTWLLTKLVRPNFVKASKQIRNGIEVEDTEITTGQDFEQYLASLEFALSQ